MKAAAADIETTLAEILLSSEQLVAALNTASPHHLEYLERRQRALDRLARFEITQSSPQWLECLQRSRVLGELAFETLRSQQTGHREQLARLQDMRVFHGDLRPPSGGHPSLAVQA